MNSLKIAFLIFLGILSFSSCEKDDICVDADTPLLIIRFYDAENPTEFKTVPSLRVVGVGNGSPVDTFDDRLSTLDSISVPLKSSDTTTTFLFTKDSADDDDGAETGNSDSLMLTYTTEEKFISRACGYVVNYNDLNIDFTASDENWIQRIEIVNTTIKTEETITAHVKIFH